jgi:hypothetical protein
VTAIYVIETDPSWLRKTFHARLSGLRFAALSSAERDTVVEMNRLHAPWLPWPADEAGQPWVISYP